MIRKLFTAGRDITVVETSAFAGTGAILKSIQAVLPEMSLAVEETGFAEKLPAQSVLVRPCQSQTDTKEITRRAMAA